MSATSSDKPTNKPQRRQRQRRSSINVVIRRRTGGATEYVDSYTVPESMLPRVKEDMERIENEARNPSPTCHHYRQAG